MVELSFAGSPRSLKKAVMKALRTRPRVLWRRWSWPLVLAIPPTALLSWLGITLAPHIHPYNAGRREFIVPAIVVAAWYLAVYLARTRGRGWSHGPYPPPAGPHVGWYLSAPERRDGRQATSTTIFAVSSAVMQVWVHSAYNNRFKVDLGTIIGGYVFWAGLIRTRMSPGPKAVAVTAAGVLNGLELYRWDQIDTIAADEGDDQVFLMVGGKQQTVEAPPGTVKVTELLAVINYYLRRPDARAGIPGVGQDKSPPSGD